MPKPVMTYLMLTDHRTGKKGLILLPAKVDPIQAFTRFCLRKFPDKRFRIGFNPDTFELRCFRQVKEKNLRAYTAELIAPVPTYSNIQYIPTIRTTYK